MSPTAGPLVAPGLSWNSCWPDFLQRLAERLRQGSAMGLGIGCAGDHAPQADLARCPSLMRVPPVASSKYHMVKAMVTAIPPWLRRNPLKKGGMIARFSQMKIAMQSFEGTGSHWNCQSETPKCLQPSYSEIAQCLRAIWDSGKFGMSYLDEFWWPHCEVTGVTTGMGNHPQMGGLISVIFRSVIVFSFMIPTEHIHAYPLYIGHSYLGMGLDLEFQFVQGVQNGKVMRSLAGFGLFPSIYDQPVGPTVRSHTINSPAQRLFFCPTRWPSKFPEE